MNDARSGTGEGAPHGPAHGLLGHRLQEARQPGPAEGDAPTDARLSARELVERIGGAGDHFLVVRRTPGSACGPGGIKP
ncbi:hypothetical protein [Streptomyces sp. NPDC092370]|uniref:hypothetical protein n=1 Tax=Streptomyces sp. NPDC092370 TaxID=3366016 RepID=UPI00381C9511